MKLKILIQAAQTPIFLAASTVLAQVSEEANAFVMMMLALIRNLLKYLKVKGKPRELPKIA